MAPQAPQGPRLARPRAAFRVPLHADLVPWLNAIETFFAELTGRRLKRGVFRWIVDLQAAINRFIEAHNHDPKPFGLDRRPCHSAVSGCSHRARLIDSAGSTSFHSLTQISWVTPILACREKMGYYGLSRAGILRTSLKMYPYEKVREVHLELTDKCNAACPQCPRSDHGGPVNPKLPLTELNLHDVRIIFPPPFVAQLHRLYACGNYGDPIVARDFLNIFQYFRACNPHIKLGIHTNGGARSVDFWQGLAGSSGKETATYVTA